MQKKTFLNKEPLYPMTAQKSVKEELKVVQTEKSIHKSFEFFPNTLYLFEQLYLTLGRREQNSSHVYSGSSARF
ncbi:hypothetical protein DLM78_01960 [Leptospira stimsonii]|uniref:Uncharacterized protein n=1 Tax=Leptospira stimsonii TaxID=2202203 RepID=A0A8B6RZ32_9LEPT|nr:hypothetical protein DLM78_01960 [Leptospira stimsonii]